MLILLIIFYRPIIVGFFNGRGFENDVQYQHE